MPRDVKLILPSPEDLLKPEHWTILKRLGRSLVYFVFLGACVYQIQVLIGLFSQLISIALPFYILFVCQIPVPEIEQPLSRMGEALSMIFTSIFSISRILIELIVQITQNTFRVKKD
jgi:hypothetical protein